MVRSFKKAVRKRKSGPVPPLNPSIELDLVDIDASIIDWAPANRRSTATLCQLWEAYRDVILANWKAQRPAEVPLSEYLTGRCPPPPVLFKPTPQPGAACGQVYEFNGVKIETAFDRCPCGTPIIREPAAYGGYEGLAKHALKVGYITKEEYVAGLEAIANKVTYRPASRWPGLAAVPTLAASNDTN